jgi:hypothetical protein
MSTDTISRMARGMGSASEHSEGMVARTVESQTARLPSDVFLWSALGAMGVSLALSVAGRQHTANFFGQWVPTLLIFGLYNKIVKVAGHDHVS